MAEKSFGAVRTLTPTVRTTHGLVRGENRSGVAVFRGIPYGGSTDGKNRFLRAKPAADWEGVRDCVPFGPICPQRGMQPGSVCGTDFMGQYFCGGDPVFWQNCHDEVMDENCLVVNVQTPGIDEKKRPVLVYVHGGGYACGASSVMMGTPKLEAEEDVVAVGINHRLNVYGFLYLGDMDKKYKDSGIVGMLDVIMGLEWVRDNIASFGGDPDNVTIMGESGGGSKVYMLMAMPEAKGLFHKAIIESGSFPVGTCSPAEATAAVKTYLDKLGVGENELDKLLTIPADTLSDTAFAMHYEPMPVGDDVHLAFNPDAGYPLYPTAMDIPVIIGLSREEFGLFMPDEMDRMTWDELPGRILQLRGGGLGGKGAVCTPDNVREMIDAVKTQAAGETLTPLQVYLRVQTLCSFGCGEFDQLTSRTKVSGVPVYAYLVTYAGPWPRERHTAWHTQDLALQFRVVLDPESEPLSRTLARAWASFARTGSPSTAELPWPVYTDGTRETMVFDKTCRVEADPLGSPRKVLIGR